MLSIDFVNNYNGKLFNDHFNYVGISDNELFFVGNQLMCMYRGKQMGTVQVVAVRKIRFIDISDVLSFLECGFAAHYLAEVVRRQAEKEGNKVDAGTLLDHVVFAYIERNLEAHSYLLTEWWQPKLPNYKSL